MQNERAFIYMRKFILGVLVAGAVAAPMPRDPGPDW